MTNLSTVLKSEADHSFDLFRISKAKETVDISHTQLRKYHREGLRFYKSDKSLFVSKLELAEFLKTRAMRQAAIAA